METWILILLAAYTIAVIRRPVWGIYFILALLPSYQIRFPVFGIPTTFLEWLVLLAAVATLINAGFSLQKFKQRFIYIAKSHSSLLLITALLLVAGAISVVVSPEFLKALGIFKAYMAEGALFLFLGLMLIDTKEKLANACKSLGLTVIYLSLFGIYQFFTLQNLPPAWWGPGIEPRRVVSLYTYPNAVALLVAPILAMFTAMLSLSQMGGGGVGNKFLSKGFLVIVNLSGLALLLLTFSRGAWIGYLAALIFLLLFTEYKKPLLTLLAVGVILLALIPTSRARLIPVLTGTDPAGLERFKLWQGTWQIIINNPIFGAGLSGFRDWYGTVRINAKDEILNYPHNFFLNFWVETGLMGLLAVIGALVWTARKATLIYNTYERERPIIIATLAAWVALTVHGLVDAPFFKNDLSLLFWFLLAIVPIIGTLKEKTV